MRIGIDLGGTKIEIIALDDGGASLLRERVPTPKTYSEIVESIVQLVRRTDEKLGKKGSVGIGIPGVLSPLTGKIKNANTVCLIGQPLDQDLAKQLGRPVVLENDANCFALSEATDGSGAGFRVVFAAILGTGVGGGISVDGRIIRGANSVGGEWGHNPLPWPTDQERKGRVCYCGRSGCMETFLSGPSFSKDFEEATKEKLIPQEILKRAEAGDKAALDAFERYENRLARGFASVINILDPDVIVIGGGMSNVQRLYTNIPKLWGQFIFSDHVATRLVQAKHGDSSGVRGAAWLKSL